MKSAAVLFITILLGSFLLTSVVDAEESHIIRVKYDNETLIFDQYPVFDNGNVLVPFRAIFEKFGLKINWEPGSKRVTGEAPAVKIDMVIGNSSVTVNGIKRNLEAAPKLVDGNTYVPLRFISESMGKEVEWDQTSYTAIIKSKFEYLGETKNFGDDSYYPENNSNQLGTVNPYIYEYDGLLYLFWSREFQNSSKENYVSFYCSIADTKENKWITKNHFVKNVKKEVGTFISDFYENAIYWRDNNGVVKVDVSPYGTASDEKYVARSVRSTKDREIMLLARMNQKPAVILGTKNSLYVYTEDLDGYVDMSLKDVNNVLFESGSNNHQYLIDRTKTKLYIFMQNGIKELNLDNGDLVYGADGKDKVTKYLGSTFSLPVYSKGNMYFLYQEGNSDRRLKVASIDDGLNFTTLGTVNYIPTSVSDKTLTVWDKGFNLWKKVDFNRKPSLELNRINYIK